MQEASEVEGTVVVLPTGKMSFNQRRACLGFRVLQFMGLLSDRGRTVDIHTITMAIGLFIQFFLGFIFSSAGLTEESYGIPERNL